MRRFETRLLEGIRQGRCKIYCLIIGGHNYSEEFLSMQNQEKVGHLYAYLEFVSDGALLPKSKFRSIVNNKKLDLYEVKKDSLRLYCIRVKPDYYLTIGGVKGNQKRDISRLIGIASEYRLYLKK